MKPAHLITTLCFALLAMGCKKEEERKFPEVKKLTEFKHTDFILTPESKIPGGKNAVYCATMLLAWDGIRGLAENDLTIAPKYADLTLLNNSKAFENTLKEGEYLAYTEYKVEEGRIISGAEFKKSLPLAIKLNTYKDRLKFKDEKVAAFGLTGMDYDLLNSARILYYKNDSDFIVKLEPKDTLHEILLYMSNDKPGKLQQMFKDMANKRQKGHDDFSFKNSWKYLIDDGADELIIPKFRFNIENDYDNLISNSLTVKQQTFVIERAWQRTAFILDEAGAEIESEAVMETTVEEMSEEEVKPHPQKLIFSKPFLVVLKRVDSPNPYFAMWVDNTELMIKE